MKLTTIWSDYQEFEDLCLVSGKTSTKETVRKIRKEQFLNDVFNGDWHKLLISIVHIFVHDKVMAKKFDYDKKLIEQTQLVLSAINTGDAKEVTKGIFDKLVNSQRITENGNIQTWYTANKHYEIVDEILLARTVETDNVGRVSIIGNKLNLDKFEIIVKINNKEHWMTVNYSSKEYLYTINNATDKKVQMSKYPEILRFINMKYFGIEYNDLAFGQFKYLVLAYCNNKLFVPKNTNGTLTSHEASRLLQSIPEAIQYLDEASKVFRNIEFTYSVKDCNRFKITREGDDEFGKMMIKNEDDYAEKRRRFPFSPRATERSFTNNTNEEKDKP